MPSFNLVCHGMMLYCEYKHHCHILIPMIDVHQYRYGDPKPTEDKSDCLPHTADLSVLPEGDFILEGIGPASTPASFSDKISDYLAIKSSKIEVNHAPARTTIVIPRPGTIALFRPVGLDVPAKILGQTPADVVVRVPPRLHDVVVFSYDNLMLGTKIRIGSWFSQELREATTTLCIYSQIGAPPRPKLVPPALGTTPDAAVLEDSHQHLARIPHATALNDFMRLSQNLAHSDFQLSVVGVADPPSPTPGYGLTKCELKNLSELTPRVTDGSGCTGAAVVKG